MASWFSIHEYSKLKTYAKTDDQGITKYMNHQSFSHECNKNNFHRLSRDALTAGKSSFQILI